MNVRDWQNNMLFRGMSEGEFRACLDALSARIRRYEKGTVILRAGDRTERMGIVLSGGVTVETNDAWGNRTILSHVGAGGFFAETFAYLDDSVLLVDVAASEDSEVLFLSLAGLKGSPGRESWQYTFLTNLLQISMHKNRTLSARSFHTAPKTVRGRVLSYLNTVSLQKHAAEFNIPFDRQALADYLNVERTALSKELGKMRADRLLECRRNHFKLNNKDNWI